MKKRISALVLALVLCLSLCGISVQAAEMPNVSGAYTGGVVAVTGTGFPADQIYSMIAVKDGGNLIALGSAKTDASGALTASVTTGAISDFTNCKVYIYNDADGTVAASGAVSGEATIVPVTSVSVTPATASLYSNTTSKTVQLTATVLPSNATDSTVVWSSSNTAVARVNTAGLVTAVANGTATITATAGGKSAACVVTVSTYTSGGGSTGGGGGGAAGGSAAPSTGTTPTVTAPSNGAVTDGAITSALTSAGKGGDINLNASASTNATLTGAAAAAVAANGSELNVSLKGGGEITVSPTVLEGLNLKATDKVSVGMTAATTTVANAVSFEVSLTVNSANIHELGGQMEIRFPVSTAWNGLSAIVEHLHADGSKTYGATTVQDGKAAARVTDLSTFTVRLASDMPAAAFADLRAEDWSFGGIEYAVEKGLFAGTSATTFAPTSPMTRQQMWMVLARLSGQTPADMDAAKAWAVSNSISDGSNPTAAVTRQQFVTLLWRTVGSPAASKDLNAYSDASAVADYAKTAFAWAVGTGAVSGTSATTLSPNGTATRAQIAVILSRYGQSVGK